MVFQNNVLAGASNVSDGLPDQHLLNQSIRFHVNDTAYMQRTPSSAGSSTAFTISFWFKVTDVVPTTINSFVSVDAGSSSAQRFRISLNDSSVSGVGSDMQILITAHTTNLMVTKQIFRDPAAWYHLVYSWDYSNSVANERQRLYINGQRITDFETSVASGSGTLPSAVGWNTAAETSIGRAETLSGTGVYYLDAYVAELINIDGTSLNPESFGETNSSGIWIPKKISGLTYGINGFRLTGQNASYLGYDYQTSDRSGTTNDFTPHGLDAHDQVTDTPTNNFAVLNPLDKGSNTTPADGNLEFTSSGDGGVRSTVFFNADKYYIEAIVGTYGSGFTFGISNADRSLSADAGLDLADFYGWYINPTQNWVASGSNPWNTGSNSASASLDVLQMAIDASDPSSIKLFAGINNTYYNSSGGSDGNPSTGANPTATITGGEEWSIGFWNRDSAASNIFVNFGQEGTFGGNKTAGGNSDANGVGNFFHNVPSGFKALCTKNLGSE
ncbi:hypothetical protein [Hyphomonas sp.]|uniref:hypothetical protein n=1 Tax=Hyphomonas sp. TaxID=87 RepID=UPI0025B8B312|nr:hypothetical protein [Hyphomonas sp.]